MLASICMKSVVCMCRVGCQVAGPIRAKLGIWIHLDPGGCFGRVRLEVLVAAKMS